VPALASSTAPRVDLEEPRLGAASFPTVQLVRGRRFVEHEQLRRPEA
jgi:hypothetical protein